MTATLTLPAPTAARERTVPVPLLLAVALLQAVSPLATDLYLPAFPALATSFHTDATGAQLTLPAFLIGTALGQLLLGPLSDRYGRRRPLLAGAAVAVLAGLAAASAPTLGLLILARALQGASCAAGMVIGRAVIADVAQGRRAAQAFALMMSISGIAPIVAPVLGGVLAGPLGWRGILAVVAGLCVVALVVVIAIVPETNPPMRRARHRDPAATPARADLRSRRFVGNALVCAFGFGAIMAYVSSAPFLYQDVLGVTPARFGLLFGVNAVVLVLAILTSSRLVAVWAPARVLRLGLTVIAAATLALGLTAGLHLPPVVFAFVLPALLAGFGLSLGNAAAAAVTAVPRASGTASALLGCAQFGLGGITSALVGLGAADPARSLAVLLAGCVTVMVAGFRFAGGSRGV